MAGTDLSSNRTRLALDRFEGDLLGHQNIDRGGMTPDTLPPSSRASTIADEDLDGGGPYYSRPTTATSVTSARFSLDSLPSNWKNLPNSRLSASPRYSLLKKPFAFVEDVEEENEEPQQEKANASEAEEAEEDTIQNDIAFQRLSMLLAGLQAQAEAAVLSPGTSLQQLGALDPSVEVEEELSEETLSTGISRSAPQSTAEITDSTVGFNASSPRIAPSFHRTSSLPFIAPRPSRRISKITISKEQEQDSTDPFTVPFSPRIPLSTMLLQSVLEPSPSTTSPLKFEPPPTPPPTLRKRPTGLDLAPAKNRILSAVSSPAPYSKPVIGSGSSSPALLARQSSYLVTDTDLEGLLNEFLEVAQMRSREGVYDVMFRCVWIYLLGGGFVWAAVGWMLGWGCRECRSCIAS